jgi:hypothetical protein
MCKNLLTVDAHAHGRENEYDFAAEGTKATKDFGAFLKEFYS